MHLIKAGIGIIEILDGREPVLAEPSWRIPLHEVKERRLKELLILDCEGQTLHDRLKSIIFFLRLWVATEKI